MYASPENPLAPAAPRRRWSWLIATAVGVAAAGVLLSGLFSSPLYPWWGYEGGYTLFEPNDRGGEGRTYVGSYRRDVRKRRFALLPGPDYLPESSFCGHCEADAHDHCAGRFRIYAEDESFTLVTPCACPLEQHREVAEQACAFCSRGDHPHCQRAQGRRCRCQADDHGR